MYPWVRLVSWIIKISFCLLRVRLHLFERHYIQIRTNTLALYHSVSWLTLVTLDSLYTRQALADTSIVTLCQNWTFRVTITWSTCFSKGGWVTIVTVCTTEKYEQIGFICCFSKIKDKFTKMLNNKYIYFTGSLIFDRWIQNWLYQQSSY